MRVGLRTAPPHPPLATRRQVRAQAGKASTHELELVPLPKTSEELASARSFSPFPSSTLASRNQC